jgi:hypothetical protein
VDLLLVAVDVPQGTGSQAVGLERTG